MKRAHRRGRGCSLLWGPEVTDTRSGRGQSEVIGVVILSAVFILLAVTVGVFVVSNVAPSSERAPLVDADANATTQTITLTHAGGETVSTADVAVVVQGDHSERYPLSSFTLDTGNDAATFAPGDDWKHGNHVGGDSLRILVVHEPSNAVLDTLVVDVEVTIAARFSTSPSSPVQGETVTFDGGDSTVKGSTITTYEWDWGDDGSVDATGESVQRSYSEEGTYDVSLTVTADDGRTATRTKSVRVFNDDPTAAFTISPSDPATGESVTFDASGSTDDSSISSYSWEFGDGTTGSGQTVSHTYSSSGSYTVNLTVTDDDGATDTLRKTLTVQAAYFDVTIDNTSSPVTAGETLTVNATINNTGNAAGTQTVTLDINGSQVDSQSVSLAAGADTTIALTWATTAGDAQDNPYVATVASANTSASTHVSVVQQQASLQINDVRGLTDESPSHDYQVAVDVEETNDVETQNLAVELVITDSGGTEAFNATKSVPGDFGELQNAERTVNFDVGQLSNGDYTWTVTASADNAATTSSSGSFAVTGPPTASIDAIDDQSTECSQQNNGKCTGGTSHTTEFQVDYSGSDADGDLTELQVELLDPKGKVVDTVTRTYSNVASASETDTLSYDHKKHWNEDFTVRVTATDADGNTDVVTQTERSDGA